MLWGWFFASHPHHWPCQSAPPYKTIKSTHHLPQYTTRLERFAHPSEAKADGIPASGSERILESWKNVLWDNGIVDLENQNEYHCEKTFTIIVVSMPHIEASTIIGTALIDPITYWNYCSFFHRSKIGMFCALQQDVRMRPNNYSGSAKPGTPVFY